MIFQISLTILLTVGIILLLCKIIEIEKAAVEFLLALTVIIVLSVILGASEIMIVFGILALMGLAIIFIGLISAYFLILLITSEKHTAQFSKVDKSPKIKINTAYYIVDGAEYPCIIPSLSKIINKRYSTDRIYKVILNRKIRRVYDIRAVYTCILGLTFSISAVMLTLRLFSVI